MECDRIVKKDDAGMAKMKALKDKAAKASGKGSKGRGNTAESEEDDDDDSDDNDSDDDDSDDDDSDDDDSDASSKKPAKKRKVAKSATYAKQASLIIPPMLQKQLLLDSEQIEKEHKWVHLPKSLETSVDFLLAEWVKSKAGKKDKAHELTVAVAQAIGVYFDKLLNVRLLYRSESAQLKQLQAARGAASKKFSQIYGVEHLLRLFGTTLPPLSVFFRRV
jgi:hypothetical protein